MHQYIQYLFIIFGSVSIMFGCDSNNNNYSEADISNKHIYCRCCNPTNDLFTIGRGGQRKGLFTDYEGFRAHFNRVHKKKLELPFGEKNTLLKIYCMGTIADNPVTEEVLERVRLQQKAEWDSKNTPSLSVPNSPLPMPMGSPTISQNNDCSSSLLDRIEAFETAVTTLVGMKKS